MESGCIERMDLPHSGCIVALVELKALIKLTWHVISHGPRKTLGKPQEARVPGSYGPENSEVVQSSQQNQNLEPKSWANEGKRYLKKRQSCQLWFVRVLGI